MELTKRRSALRQTSLTGKPAAVFAALGVHGKGGRSAVCTPTLNAARAILAAELPFFESGHGRVACRLDEFLLLAEDLAKTCSITPSGLTAAWVKRQQAASRAESASRPNCKISGADASRNKGRSDGRKSEHQVHHPATLLAEHHPLDGAAKGSDDARLTTILGEQDESTIGTPGAPAALAGEEAGRAPASSAGARRAQPLGKHVARVLTASAWMHRNPGLVGVLAGNLSGMVLGHGTPAALAEKLLENQAQVLAQLGQGFRVTRARVRVVAADIIRALRCGDLTRSADGVVAVLSFVTHQALALFDIKTRPTAKAISPAMAKHLASLGVDPSGLSQRDARVLSMVLHGRRRSSQLSYKQLVAIARAGGYGLLDLSQWVVFEAGQEHFEDIMRAAWRATPGAELADTPVAEPQVAGGFAIRQPGRRYALRPFAAEPDSGKPQQHPEIQAMHARLDGARAAGFVTIRQRLPALRLALVQKETLKWYAKVLGVSALTDEQKAEAPDAKAAHNRERFVALAAISGVGRIDALRRYEGLIRGASDPCALQACELDEAALLFADLDDLAANEHPAAAGLGAPEWLAIDSASLSVPCTAPGVARDVLAQLFSTSSAPMPRKVSLF